MPEAISVEIVVRDQPEARATDLCLFGSFEGESPEAGDIGDIDAGLGEAVARLAGRPGWTGTEDQSAQTDLGAGGLVVALSGLGRRDELTAAKVSAWIASTSERARINGFRNVRYFPPRHPETTGRSAAERTVRWLGLAGYRFDRRSEETTNGGRLERVLVTPPAGEEDAYRAAVRFSQPIADAAAYSRNLANTPPNEATTLWMAERARELAEERGLEITILDEREMAARRMGGILAVGSGSANPPRLVRLAWGSEGPAVALVGKGVTFDTGGISIKPASNMEDMKFDKSGACTVLGIVRAVADLGLRVRLRAYLPFAENMPGGASYRPGDILRLSNQKTVEITNTDAEGRLILADALAWAAAETPDSLLEFSTLTGGIVVALGHQAAGLFAPDEGLAAELLETAADSGERLWRLPIYPEYLEDMKGLHADLKNSAGRAGSSGTAAAFLSQFVGEIKRWAHVDIAGVAYHSMDSAGKRGGATAFGVATAVTWLRRCAG